MGVAGDVNRLVKKGLAEGLNDDQVLELLTDHNIKPDKAQNILQKVKENLRTPDKSARESLQDRAADMRSDEKTEEDLSDEGEKSFEEAFEEPVDEKTSDDSSNTDKESKSKDPASSDPEASQVKNSFNNFEDQIEKDEEETTSDGIFSKLTGLFSSSEQSGEKETKTTDKEENQSQDNAENESENQTPENPDWDAEELKELAREATDKGLAEEEILKLFGDHGVPEPYTRQLLENAKRERKLSAQRNEEEDQVKSRVSAEDEIESAEKNSLDENIEEVDINDLPEGSESEAHSKQTFDTVFAENPSDASAEKTSSGNSNGISQTPDESMTSKDIQELPSSGADREPRENVSAAKLDQETLQAMAQHGIAKGFDREDLISFFGDHGVDKKRAKNVIEAVFPSGNQNTQGRRQSEHEGLTETSEAKDAVAVQKQEQVTTAKDEEESFMSDMDKSKESLKVGRIYLTGRKPSYGRMRVKGLQDITGNEFESGGRNGFIDLSDTEEHIGEEEEKPMDDSQQVEDDRIREQT